MNRVSVIKYCFRDDVDGNHLVCTEMYDSMRDVRLIVNNNNIIQSDMYDLYAIYIYAHMLCQGIKLFILYCYLM